MGTRIRGCGPNPCTGLPIRLYAHLRATRLSDVHVCWVSREGQGDEWVLAFILGPINLFFGAQKFYFGLKFQKNLITKFFSEKSGIPSHGKVPAIFYIPDQKIAYGDPQLPNGTAHFCEHNSETSPNEQNGLENQKCVEPNEGMPGNFFEKSSIKAFSKKCINCYLAVAMQSWVIKLQSPLPPLHPPLNGPTLKKCIRVYPSPLLKWASLKKVPVVHSPPPPPKWVYPPSGSNTPHEKKYQGVSPLPNGSPPKYIWIPFLYVFLAEGKNERVPL